MPWTKVCAADDIAAGGAGVFAVEGVSVLMIRARDGYMAFSPVCPHVPQFLVHGDVSGCFDAGVAQCNRHLEEAGKDASPGMCDAPIFMYPAMEADDGIYVDIGKRELSRYQRITCSPVLEGARLSGLRFSLWLDGEHRESIYARPARAARS